jgi:hypothetical protein
MREKKTMPSEDPKTRTERKGRDKRTNNTYSSKHVRQQERIAEKKKKENATKK